MPEGSQLRIGQLEIEVRDKKAFISGTNTLCGSIAPLDECIRIFRKSTGKFTFTLLTYPQLFGNHYIHNLEPRISVSKKWKNMPFYVN